MTEFTVKALQKCVYNNTLYAAGDEFLFEADKASDVPKHMTILYAPKAAAKDNAVAVQEKTVLDETEKAESEAVAEEKDLKSDEKEESGKFETASEECAAEEVQKTEEAVTAAEKDKPAAQSKKRSSKR